ncbi:DNA-processing protein DprA [Algirhabdus cladophorae]|uniref:DNA-processing protein DprA n=1 Tax=Algirhabdus cladophorae TaxID=3377108 RepID=UPI003B847935
MTEELPSSTHPPLPPTTEDDRVAWLRLLRSRRVGVSTFYRVLGEHGTAQAALKALPEVAAAAGVTGYKTCPEGVVRAEMQAAKMAGAQLLCRGDKNYPAYLSNLDDAPPLLWAIGDLTLLQRELISLVGARNASSLGGRMAKSLARELGAEGYGVVSGLARGIDAAAHVAALETGTIAVLAGGVDKIYPAENAGLAEDIAKTGVLLSDQPMGMTPTARLFPRRNKIVSGLSIATIVVEAAAKSGSLITARNALDQGRDVMAVPGHPFDARAAGCNMLLRDGATLVRNAADVLEALPEGQTVVANHQQPDLPLTAPRGFQETVHLHKQLLDRLGPTPVPEDQLVRDMGLGAQATGPALVDLELDGKILRHPGGLVSRAS